MENLIKIIFYYHAKKPLWKSMLPFCLLDFCFEPTWSSVYSTTIAFVKVTDYFSLTKSQTWTSSYLTLSAWKVEHFLLFVMSFHWVSWLSRSTGCFYFCLVCLFCFCLAGCSWFFLSTKWGTLHRLQFLDFSSSLLTLYLADLVQCNGFKYHPMLQISNSYSLLSFLLWTFDSSQQFTVHLIVQSIQSSTATSDIFPLNLFFPMSVHGILAVVRAQITGVIFSPVFLL